jgi:hypothetical protein
VGGFGVAMMAAARVTTVAAISLSNNTPTALSFDTERFNSGEWSSSVNPSRITAIVDGIYSISGSASFSPNATGQRKLDIRLNGSSAVASQQITNASAAVATNLTVTTVMSLLAGDYVEVVASQTSGGNLDVLKSDKYSPEFAAVRLSAFDTASFQHAPPTPSGTPPGVTDTQKVFSITDIGWYRIWSGEYPASASFNIKRSSNGDGQTSDTTVDATIIADSPEGIINVSRNSIPTPASPSIDGVRVYHDSTALLAYIDVHLIRGGEWTLQYSGADTNFVDAPFVTTDVVTLPLLTYSLKANVTGGTGTIDVPQVDSGGNKLIGPPVSTWAAPTGTNLRTTFNADAPPTLTQLSQHVKSIIDDLVAAGIFTLGLPSTMAYTDMLGLAPNTVSEGSVANVTDVFNITAAPDTTVQGIYTPVADFNSHAAYRMQGYEYETGSTRVVRWSTEHSTWTIVNASGNLYHSGGSESHPWSVVQWKDEANSNVTVTITSPNIAFTYNALTDTHTAMVITDTIGTSGYAGLYLRGSDVNSKRSYSLVGTSTNNKRIEWTGSAWNIKDDSATFATSSDAVTYPDQVTSWFTSSGTILVTSINAVDLMSGVTMGGGDIPFNDYDGTYTPVLAEYNILGGRKLIYRRTDGLYFLASNGSDTISEWCITDTSYNIIGFSNTGAATFPWNASWTGLNMTAQQNKVASGGFVNTYANNATGNWHL